MKPMVSVVIPTFNRGIFVVHAVESVLQQTYGSYEIIVVDDGSEDDTATKLRPYFNRIRYHRQENQGVSVARNIGIGLAEGEWIANLDSDDTWDPRKLELQMAALAEFDQEAGACFTNCSFVGGAHGEITAFQVAGFDPGREIGMMDEPTRWILARHPIVYIPSVVVKRGLVLDGGGFDSQLIVSEDTDLLFRLSLKTAFCFVNHALVNIDIVPNRTERLSQLYMLEDDRAFSSREIMFKKWLQLFDGGLDMALRKHICDLLIRNYYHWLKKRIKRSEWSNLHQLLWKIRHCEVGWRKYSLLFGLVCASGLRRMSWSSVSVRKTSMIV